MTRQKVKQTFITILAGIIVIGVFTAVYKYSAASERRRFAEVIADYGPRKGVPRTIEDLQKAIAAYEAVQEEFVKAAAQTGTYWKILGTRFQNKGMWGEAVQAFQHGIEYTPDDEVLHYLLAVNAAQMAKSVHDASEKARYYALAEAAYKRAIDLEPTYTQARYGLAVLDIFEIDKPDDAVTQLLEYMKNRSEDADSMFLLARALFMSGRYREAVEWYDRGIPLTKDKLKRDEAQANRNFIVDKFY